MTRTTIMLPTNLKTRASRHAHTHGQSLGQLIRESLENRLKNIFSMESRESDPFWADNAVFMGSSPKDLSKRHDEYLYGDLK